MRCTSIAHPRAGTGREQLKRPPVSKAQERATLPWADADAPQRVDYRWGSSGFACLAHGEQALPHHPWRKDCDQSCMATSVIATSRENPALNIVRQRQIQTEGSFARTRWWKLTCGDPFIPSGPCPDGLRSAIQPALPCSGSGARSGIGDAAICPPCSRWPGTEGSFRAEAVTTDRPSPESSTRAGSQWR